MSCHWRTTLSQSFLGGILSLHLSFELEFQLKSTPTNPERCNDAKILVPAELSFKYM